MSLTTIVPGPGRVPQIIWGTRLQNALTFAYPAGLDEPRFWRATRVGGEQVFANNIGESWTAGRDWFATFMARWFSLDLWAGGAGLQAFLDWAMDGNAFTFVPDAYNAPYFAIPGCLLQEPFTTVAPTLEANGAQSIPLRFRNPTYDLGLAWRGLMFEYAPGADLTAPSGGAAVFGQAQPTGFYDATGIYRAKPANAIRDRHYPLGFSGSWNLGSPLGSRVTAIEQTVTNKVTFPEDINNAAWTKTFTTTVPTSPGNTPASPRGDATAVLVKEDSTTNSRNAQFNYTLSAAGNTAGFTAFVRAAGRTKGRLRINNTGGPEVSVSFTLVGNGTIDATSAGIKIADIRPVAAAPLAGSGWYVVTGFGTPGGSSTSASMALHLHDASHNESYLGDGASGMYLWGVVATDNQVPRAYWGTGAAPANDALTWPIASAFLPQPQFWYLKFTELGLSSNFSGFPSIINNQGGGAGSWRFLVYGPGAGAAYTGSTGTLAGSPGIQQDFGVPGGNLPVFGDTVELLIVLDGQAGAGPPGNVASGMILQSRNGGAVVSNGPGAGCGQRTFSGVVSTLLDLTATGGAGGGIGWQKIKIGPLYYMNQTINTMPLARAL